MRAGEAVAPAERKRIHIFISTSALHMKYKLRMEPEAVLQAVTDSVTLARQYTDDVEWSAEDGSRTDPDFLCRCVEAAIAAGATTINIPDTVGYALPEDMARIFTMLRERVPGAERVIFSAHNHNDLGLAVANTIAAVRAGVRQIECTINGIGERAGNAALEEIVMALRTRPDAVPCKPDIVTHEHPAHVAPAVHHHRLRRAAEQGDRRPQRVRARERHPPGRRAEERRHLRDHDAGKRRLDQVQPGDGQAFRPRRLPRQAEARWAMARSATTS